MPEKGYSKDKQNRWQESRKGRWTHRIIPRVKRWVERKHGEVGYHLTQALTGHGCFADYLLGIGKLDSRECVYCGEIDDAEHTVFHCNRWTEERRGISHLRPEELVEFMLLSKDNWAKAETAIMRIVKLKGEDERNPDLFP